MRLINLIKKYFQKNNKQVEPRKYVMKAFHQSLNELDELYKKLAE